MFDSEQIVKRFSMRTYLKDREGKRGISPVHESNRLLKSIMEELVQSNPDASPEKWARDFLKSLFDGPKIYSLFVRSGKVLSVVNGHLIYGKICQEFLFNYLQPVCWQAALKINENFQGSPHIYLQYPVEECFIIGSSAIYQPTKIFKRFDFKANFSLDGYAFNTLKRIIRNQIAKELKSKSLKFSDNGLLRSLDKKELEKFLTEYGIQPQERELYCLAWQSFKDLFEEFYPSTNSDGSRRRNPPTTPLNEAQVNQIATRYNQQLKRLEIATKTANSQDIGQMLDTCIQAVRTGKMIRPASLENQVTGDVSDLGYNPFELVIEQETKEEFAQLRHLILQAFNSLEKTGQNCLLLWLGLKINQQDFLEVLQLDKQYQVTRKFQSYQKTILKSTVSYAFEEYLSQKPTEKEVNQIVKSSLEYIKEYLATYSRSFFAEILEVILTQQISREERRILLENWEALTHYIQEVKTSSKQRNLMLLNAQDEYLQISGKLLNIFAQSIKKRLQFSLDNFSSSRISMAKFIANYLQENLALFY